MATDKIALRTVEEFMAGYTPVYQPIYPLFLGKSQAYSEEAGKADLRRVNTIGDIRGKHITPKDTEISQIAISESKKTFKKYFLANQFQISNMQDQQGIEDVIAQVLDEHQTQMDELFLLGEGTSASDMINNSLFWSNDSNYVLESSAEVQKDVDNNYLSDLHAKIMQNVTTADRISGRKVMMFYGTNILPLFDSLYPGSSKPFKGALQEVLGANYSLAKLPSAITPSGANGWMIANLDQVKLHYTALPALKSRGVNEEKMYSWANFIMGSCLLEVLSSGGIVRQPSTLEA
jgi:hypothetical protein